MKNGEKNTVEKKKQKNPLAFFFRHKPYFFNNNNNNNRSQGLMITGIFGAPLEFAAQCGTITSFGLSVPDPVNRCFNEILERGLRIEGLFRLSGATVEVEALQMEFDKPPTYGKYLDLKNNDIHAITSLVKKYLRTLPDPVIPSVSHSSFLQLFEGWKKEERGLVLEWAKLIQNELPKTNFDVLHYIILVASWVQHYQHLNRMNPEALAVVLAPICSGLENNIYGQLKSTSSSSTTNSSSNHDHKKLPSSSYNDINISNYQQIKENMDQLIQLNIKWTSIWTLMIQHHDVMLDYWRSSSSTHHPSILSSRDISHPFLWQRHSMPTTKTDNNSINNNNENNINSENNNSGGRTHLLWTQSTITVPEEKINHIDDDDDDDDDDDNSSLLPSSTSTTPTTTKLLSDDERYGVIIIRKQQHGFRRRILSGVAKDDENIYLDTPLPPLPIPSYTKEISMTSTINNNDNNSNSNNNNMKFSSMDQHASSIKNTKKRPFLLRRPKSIATLQPRMKTTVL